MKTKRIAIIGAGAGGLTAIKCCKEVGFEPVCLERNYHPGGLWRYQDENIEGFASVMKSTISNSSKEMGAFSDFPPPEDYPNFMHHSQMYDYFMMYANHFDLLRHIRYNLKVIGVVPTEDYETTGHWLVSMENLNTGEISKETYDAVLVCVGHHVYPRIPAFPGQEKFRGTITHSHSIKSCEQFSGKRVVVVGIGSSAVDVAVDCSNAAEKVYLSTRRGSWIFSRIGKNGRPYDMDFVSRKKMLFRKFMPYNAVCNEYEKVLNGHFDHEAYRLKPKHRVFSAHPTVSDALPYCILNGRVIVKGDIERFDENGVLFVGEDKVTEADVVIFGTGYVIKFPFLGDLVQVEDNKVDLYKHAIPPALKHHTLAIIGLIQTTGPFFPVFEMQCRWFCQILLGNVKLPSPEAMHKEIKAKHDANAEKYVGTNRHTIQADWVSLMDEMSSMFGAKPNLMKIALTDPMLFLQCFNGACLPYQYRLQGPFAWSGARDAILNYEKRVFTPLNPDGKVITLNEGNCTTLIISAACITGLVLAIKHYLAF